MRPRGPEATAGRTTETRNDQESTTSRSLCNTGGDSRDAFRKRQPLGDATSAIRYGRSLYGWWHDGAVGETSRRADSGDEPGQLPGGSRL
jgi:hypothetical protein